MEKLKTPVYRYRIIGGTVVIDMFTKLKGKYVFNEEETYKCLFNKKLIDEYQEKFNMMLSYDYDRKGEFLAKAYKHMQHTAPENLADVRDMFYDLLKNRIGEDIA